MVNTIAKKRFEDQRNTYIAEDRKLRELGEKRKAEEREREEFKKGLAEEMPMKMVTEPMGSVTAPGEGKLFEEIKDFAGIGDEKDEKWEQEFISGFKKNTNIPSVAGTKQGLSDSMAIRVGVDEEVINKIKAEAEPKIGKDIFTESVEKGIADTSAAITGGIDFIFGNFLKGFGWENNPISAVNEYYQGLKRRKDEDLAKAVEKTGKGKAAEYGATLISGTVAAIPNLIIAGMSGGALAVGQAGGKVVPALGKMIRNPAFLYSFETSLYPEYEYAVQNGASEAEATVMAPIAALLSAGIETAGGIETVPTLMKDENTRRKIFREWFKIAVEEGNEEVLQGLSTELLQKVIFDHDKKTISFDENKNAVMNVPNLARDWTLGTAVGGILGAPVALRGAMDKKRIPDIEKRKSEGHFEESTKFVKDVKDDLLKSEIGDNITEQTVDNIKKNNIIKINQQFFAEKDLSNQSSGSLKKGIRHLEKKIELHKLKIKNPEKYDEGWSNKMESEKIGLIRHWKKEIQNYNESINNRIEELKKRGEKDE